MAKSDKQKSYVYVAGSAHLDIIASITGDEEVVDKIGSIEYEFGGTAYNIAINLQALGAQAVFTGAFNQSPMSQMIVTEMMNHGVRTHIKTISSLPEAGFSAHLVKGDLYSAVSSMPVEQVAFSDEFFAQGLSYEGQKACCMVLDCNLSPATLATAIKHGRKEGVPVYVAGVSEAKCLRLLEVDLPPDIIFLNLGEMAHFLKHMPQAESFSQLAEYMGATFIVTRGGEGVTVYTPDGKEQNFDIKAANVITNTLGAGDMFCAAFVQAHAINGQEVSQAVNCGFKEAASLLQRQNASLGRAHALNSNIELITSHAEHDKLTGMLNRHGLESFMKKCTLFEKPFFIILFDVDHFKKFNDTYGHETGDQVLKKVGGVITKHIRKNDAASRWGGEEFMCLVEGDDARVANNIAERILKGVEKLKIENVSKPITLSAGIAFSDAQADWDEVFKKADTALYTAKENGRNQIVMKAATKIA